MALPVSPDVQRRFAKTIMLFLRIASQSTFSNSFASREPRDSLRDLHIIYERTPNKTMRTGVAHESKLQRRQVSDVGPETGQRTLSPLITAMANENRASWLGVLRTTSSGNKVVERCEPDLIGKSLINARCVPTSTVVTPARVRTVPVPDRKERKAQWRSLEHRSHHPAWRQRAISVIRQDFQFFHVAGLADASPGIGVVPLYENAIASAHRGRKLACFLSVTRRMPSQRASRLARVHKAAPRCIDPLEQIY
jgi:hypothetical protein